MFDFVKQTSPKVRFSSDVHGYQVPGEQPPEFHSPAWERPHRLPEAMFLTGLLVKQDSWFEIYLRCKQTASNHPVECVECVGKKHISPFHQFSATAPSAGASRGMSRGASGQAGACERSMRRSSVAKRQSNQSHEWEPIFYKTLLGGHQKGSQRTEEMQSKPLYRTKTGDQGTFPG